MKKSGVSIRIRQVSLVDPLIFTVMHRVRRHVPRTVPDKSLWAGSTRALERGRCSWFHYVVRSTARMTKKLTADCTDHDLGPELLAPPPLSMPLYSALVLPVSDVIIHHPF